MEIASGKTNVSVHKSRFVWYGLIATIVLGLGLLAIWRIGPVMDGVTAMLYAWLLLAIAVIDLDQRRIPDRLLLVGVALAVGFSLLVGIPALLSALTGGIAGYTTFRLLSRIRSGAMGRGDVKLAGVIGLMSGFPGVVLALLIGMVAGGVAAIFLLVSGRGSDMMSFPMRLSSFLEHGSCYCFFLISSL